MVTFEGHVVTSFSCRESRCAQQSTFHARFFYQSDFATYFDFQLFSSRINKQKNKRIILKFACLS